MKFCSNNYEEIIKSLVVVANKVYEGKTKDENESKPSQKLEEGVIKRIYHMTIV